MKHNSLFTSSGRKIDVYDEVFSHYEQEVFEGDIINNARFSYNGEINHSTKHNPATYLHCRLDKKDVQQFKFFFHKNVKQILNNYGNIIFNTAWFNLSLPGTYYSVHTDLNKLDLNQITLMYYATTTWEDKYGGETLFYSDKLEKEIVVDYLPGRIVIFDSKIPHKPAFSYGHIQGRIVFVAILEISK